MANQDDQEPTEIIGTVTGSGPNLTLFVGSADAILKAKTDAAARMARALMDSLCAQGFEESEARTMVMLNLHYSLNQMADRKDLTDGPQKGGEES